jgi:outer membrane protein TolC
VGGDWTSRFWAIGPSAAQTIFNGGLSGAQLPQYEAIYNSDVAPYRQIVLRAFEQVEDALASTRVYSQEILRQQEAAKSSRKYLETEMRRYKTAVDTYVNVVTGANDPAGKSGDAQ